MHTPLRQLNPQSAPAYNGLSGDQSPQAVFEDVSFDYIHDIVIGANLQNQFEKTIAADADFAWRAIVVVSSTDAFSVQFSDSQWYYLQSGLVSSALFSSDPANPSPVWPELLIPASGRIAVNLRDDSGAENTIQLAYKGVKRYRLK